MRSANLRIADGVKRLSVVRCPLSVVRSPFSVLRSPFSDAEWGDVDFRSHEVKPMGGK